MIYDLYIDIFRDETLLWIRDVDNSYRYMMAVADISSVVKARTFATLSQLGSHQLRSVLSWLTGNRPLQSCSTVIVNM